MSSVHAAQAALTIEIPDTASHSSSAFVGGQTISITNTSEIIFDDGFPGSTPTRTLSRPFRRNITYSDDTNATIAGVPLPTGLNFRSFELLESIQEIPNAESGFPIPIPYFSHTIGLGFRATSPKYFWAVQSGLEPANGQGNASVIVDELLSQDIIRSNTYSIWRDTAEKGSPGQVLLGGLDESAFTAPLINLETYVVNSTNSPDWQAPGLVVNTSLVSITPDGQQGLDIDFPSHQTTIGAGNGIFLPNTLAGRMFDLLGANLTVRYDWQPVNMTEAYRRTIAQAIVPCSYLTNTTTIDFSFTGTNLTVAVPISDITIQLGAENGWPETVCQLMVRASLDDESPAAFGEELLKRLYRVYDLENEVISVALRDFEASGNGTVKPIPTQGGVAAMDLSTVEEGSSGDGSGGAAGNNTSGAMGLTMTGGNVGLLSTLLGLGLVMMCL